MKRFGFKALTLTLTVLLTTALFSSCTTIFKIFKEVINNQETEIFSEETQNSLNGKNEQTHDISKDDKADDEADDTETDDDGDSTPETGDPETGDPEVSAPETNAPESSAPETNDSESNETETRFDYANSNLSEYVSVNDALYKNVSIKLPAYLNGTDEAVTAYIQLLCNAYAESTGNKIVDKAIENGDTVAIYYEGWLDGEKFAGGSNMDDADPYMLTIGSGEFIPGFEEGLIGLVPCKTGRDNTYDLHVTFPEDYHSAEMAGKAVVFKVYIEYIDEMAPAEYTEEFITEILGYTTDNDDVKADFEKYLKETHLPEAKKSEILNAVWTDLIDNATVTQYPQSELDYYYNSYVEQYEYYKMYYEMYGISFASLDEFVTAYLGLNEGEDWKEVTLDYAKSDVKQNLIFHAIAQNEKLTVTDEDYKSAIQYYVDYYNSQGYNVTAEQIVAELGERMIKEQALWDKVNEFIVSNAAPIYE